MLRGDAVLVGVARGLERVAAESARDVAGVENSVIRLGGDEFLLTLHGPEPFDLDMFHERVDAVRTSSIEYDGDGLQLDFSLGIERSDGPSDLSDLMHRADLAVYGDKAARAEARGASMRIDSTGDGARGGTSGSGTASGTT
jgi:GGDEF domain-containing protein